MFFTFYRVVFTLCGGNIDSTVLGRVIERGLAADGRMIRFSVIISDRPGGLAKLTKILGDGGARYTYVEHSVFTGFMSKVIPINYKLYEFSRKKKGEPFEIVTP